MKPDRLDAFQRFVPLFGAPEIPFERFVRRRDRKRRNQRIAAAVVGISIFMAAVAIVASEAGSDRTRTPVAPPTYVAPEPPLVPRIGLVGLAPKGMSPSPPLSGELVVSFFFAHTMGDPGRFHVYVYEDGRMIWQRLGDSSLGTSSTGLIEQRLTPEGVEAMRSEVLATGLFETDTRFANNHGLFGGDIGVRDGGRFVRVTWGDIGVDEPATIPTVEQANALNRLDARFADPVSWLSADAWQDPEMRPFVPSRYSVCYGTEGLVGAELGEVLASLPRPVEETLGGFQRSHEVVESSYISAWCSVMTTFEAHALAGLLDDAGIRGRASVFGLAFTFPDAYVDFLSIDPMLPDQL